MRKIVVIVCMIKFLFHTDGLCQALVTSTQSFYCHFVNETATFSSFFPELRNRNNWGVYTLAYGSRHHNRSSFISNPSSCLNNSILTGKMLGIINIYSTLAMTVAWNLLANNCTGTEKPWAFISLKVNGTLRLSSQASTVKFSTTRVKEFRLLAFGSVMFSLRTVFRFVLAVVSPLLMKSARYSAKSCVPFIRLVLIYCMSQNG